MRPIVLLTHAIHPQAQAHLSKAAEVRVLSDASHEGLLKEIVDADALLVRMPVPAQAIEAGRKLRVVARHGVGLDYIPVAACTARRIPVVYTPNANTESVAEHVVGAMIALAHHFGRADRGMRAGNWNVRNSFMGLDLQQRILGVIGLGRIGTRVAQICQTAFQMRVVARDPHLSSTQIQDRGALPMALEDLLKVADFITLHAPLDDNTRGMMNAASFSQIKPGSFLINAARGGLIETSALVAALKSGRLAGAALDVFEEEPPPRDSELLRLENVLLTPHSAALTEEAMLRMGMDASDDILRVLAGEAPKNCANPDVLS